jgi:ankyrin repeat protein
VADPALDQELLEAAYANDVDEARRLVAAGADVNAKDQSVQSAYLIATSEVGDDPRLLELTLENGADVRSLDSYEGTGLIRAADRGYTAIVARLLETDIDFDHVNRLGWTALLEAIILGGGDPAHTEVVRLLVDAGADVNLADGQGVTPLTHAEESGYAEMAKILRAAGAHR